MSQHAQRRPRSALVTVGSALVVVGLLSWALYALSASHERRSFTHGGAPPAFAAVTAGHTYHLAIPGGRQTERDRGLDPAKLVCTASESGSTPGALSVLAESSDKAIDRIGSFVAGQSGSFRINCTGLGAVYVDDADDAGFDWSGLWVVLACVALAIGLPLVLAGLRQDRERSVAADPGEYEQVE